MCHFDLMVKQRVYWFKFAIVLHVGCSLSGFAYKYLLYFHHVI